MVSIAPLTPLAAPGLDSGLSGTGLGTVLWPGRSGRCLSASKLLCGSRTDVIYPVLTGHIVSAEFSLHASTLSGGIRKANKRLSMVRVPMWQVGLRCSDMLLLRF